jgi:hypothetical protein
MILVTYWPFPFWPNLTDVSLRSIASLTHYGLGPFDNATEAARNKNAVCKVFNYDDNKKGMFSSQITEVLLKDATNILIVDLKLSSEDFEIFLSLSSK